MHLMPIYYNNNNNKKRKKTFRKAGWQKAQAEHDAWLMKRGVHPSQLKNKTKNAGIKAPNYKEHSRALPTSDYTGPIVGKSKKKYLHWHFHNRYCYYAQIKYGACK